MSTQRKFGEVANYKADSEYDSTHSQNQLDPITAAHLLVSKRWIYAKNEVMILAGAMLLAGVLVGILLAQLWGPGIH